MNIPITLVIPCYNSSETIEAVINAALKEDFYELICINNNSNDDTLEILEKLPVLIVEEKQQGTVWARRAGAACAETEWLAMIDDDVILQPGWKQSMLDFLKLVPDASAITGYVDTPLPPRLSWAKTYLATNSSCCTQEYTVHSQPLGAATFIRRKAYLEHTKNPTLVGRDDRYGTLEGCGEDIEVFRKIMRAGGRMFHNPKAKAIHQVEEWRKDFNYLVQLEKAYTEGRYVKKYWSY